MKSGKGQRECREKKDKTNGKHLGGGGKQRRPERRKTSLKGIKKTNNRKGGGGFFKNDIPFRPVRKTSQACRGGGNARKKSGTKKRKENGNSHRN